MECPLNKKDCSSCEYYCEVPGFPGEVIECCEYPSQQGGIISIRWEGIDK